MIYIPFYGQCIPQLVSSYHFYPGDLEVLCTWLRSMQFFKFHSNHCNPHVLLCLWYSALVSRDLYWKMGLSCGLFMLEVFCKDSWILSILLSVIPYKLFFLWFRFLGILRHGSCMHLICLLLLLALSLFSVLWNCPLYILLYFLK